MKVHQFKFTSRPSGNILIDGNKKYLPVVKLGIQGHKGVKFSINESDQAIEMNSNGIYELDLTNIGGRVMSLTFASGTIDSDNPLLVDIVYEEVLSI